MADNELTVEEIDLLWSGGHKPDDFEFCVPETAGKKLCDMARRYATEIPKLEADLTKQTIKANYLEGEFGDLLKERDQLETQLATATAQVEELKDQLVQTRAYYAPRDQRMREALQAMLDDFGLYADASVKMASDALASHPADNDASKFAEKVKGEVVRDLISWTTKRGASAWEVAYMREYAEKHGIMITPPTPEPDVEPHDGAALREIAAERRRQIEQEGWSPDHDDGHDNRELARAAAAYVLGSYGFWPWDAEWWKPSSRRRDLIKGAALIVAEIERLDRAENHNHPNHHMTEDR